MSSRLRVALVGYGRQTEPRADAPGRWRFTDPLHSYASEWACLAGLRGELDGLHGLSDWHGVVTLEGLPGPAGTDFLVWRQSAAQRQWASGCVAWLLGRYPGRSLLLEVHDYRSTLHLLQAFLPACWGARAGTGDAFTAAARRLWYFRELERLGQGKGAGQ